MQLLLNQHWPLNSLGNNRPMGGAYTQRLVVTVAYLNVIEHHPWHYRPGPSTTSTYQPGIWHCEDYYSKGGVYYTSVHNLPP